MRFANVRGRASIVVADNQHDIEVIDIETASNGLFTSDPMAALARWDELRRSVEQLLNAEPTRCTRKELHAPSPRPLQVFGIGLNYREHANETGAPLPDTPLTFTKFPSSINAPDGDIPIEVPTADWEVEVVVVIGAGGRHIGIEHAWDAIAGICVGQDISDRLLQRATQPPQFSLGKSRRGYSPFGPWLTDARTMSSPDALVLHCTVNGLEMQRSSTSDMIFSVPHIVAYLSNIVELLPGDVIFTGTPSGVGGARTPPRFLSPGDVIVSSVEGVGSITNRCV